ncbi:MAG: hypothetical protein GTO03_08490, partial [Planctomycetales bacterium]|nr:hypothetical protein [Planctomycetales bacterium]
SSEPGEVVPTGYQETNSRLNWQQPGVSSGTSEAGMASSDPGRVELAELPRSVARGQQGSQAAAGKVRPAAAASQYGFSHDYRWLRGQLEYSAAAQQWKLRYIPIDGQTDRYGGSLVLEAVPELSSYRDGDFVQVQGIVRGQEGSSGSPATAYRITRLARLRKPLFR